MHGREIENIAESLLLQCRDLVKHPYWSLTCLEPSIILEDFNQKVEPQTPTSSAGAPSECSDTESEEAEAGTAPEGQRNEAPAWHRRIEVLKNSPHPRRAQEIRLITLAKEWHPWVTVPETIHGVPMDATLLRAAIALPRKHCFWSGCTWTGDTNEERCEHILAARNSKYRTSSDRANMDRRRAPLALRMASKFKLVCYGNFCCHLLDRKFNVAILRVCC